MKTFLIIISFFLVIFSSSCKKKDNVNNDTNDAPVNDYDVVNKLFRVDVVPTNSLVEVTITHIKPNTTEPYNYEQARQNSEFNYAFTPMTGDTVKVIVKSNAAMSVYVAYTNTNIEPSVKTMGDNGSTYAEYLYVVKK